MRVRPVRLLLLLLVLAAIGAGAWLIYERYTRTYTVTREDDGRAITRVIDARLERMGDLRVSRLKGIVQASSTDERMGGVLRSSRVMKAPFEVSYFVDLAKLDRGDFFWDGRGRTLIVKVPDVRIDTVNIDEARTSVDRTSGVFVTRAAMAELRRRASLGAERVARAEAEKPANMSAARRNAARAIETLFARPLRIAGVDAQVQVQFAGQPAANPEQWDRSRSLAEIYGE